MQCSTFLRMTDYTVKHYLSLHYSGCSCQCSVNVENQNACKLWRASVCTFHKSRRRVTERSMAESKKRTGTSIPRRMSDLFSVLSSTITSERKEPFCIRSASATAAASGQRRTRQKP